MLEERVGDTVSYASEAENEMEENEVSSAKLSSSSKSKNVSKELASEMAVVRKL
jgi:hypothetical protein